MQPDELPDYYAALGLDERCTGNRVRDAYRALSKRHHPDLNPDDPGAITRSQELNAAYTVLSDPSRRREYDRQRQGAESASTRKGKIEKNIAQDVHLRIDELLRGTSLDVQVSDPANPNGPETYRVEVPSNTPVGTRIRVARDEPFRGGWVQVRVKMYPGSRFKARGSDLQCDLRINARRAAQGGSEMLPSAMGGQLCVEIPAGVGRGEILRVPGEGLPKSRGGRGDLLVKVVYRPEVRVTRAG